MRKETPRSSQRTQSATPPQKTVPNKAATRSHYDATEYTAKPPKTAWMMWTGIALSLIWVATSIAVYFGLFGKASAPLSPIALSAIILAITLPAILITLLWGTWKRLAHMSHEAGRVAHAAHLLTRADETALINTRNLAVGIQSELSIVDQQLGKMLDRFETLKNDITTHSQDINTVGLTLTERSEDVGRNLTLQRQALESITNTFDTRMEALGTTIETQSVKLSEVTDIAARNMETAEQKITQASETLSKVGDGIHETSQTARDTLEKSVGTLTSHHEKLGELHTQITNLIGALTTQQDAIKSELLTQSETLQDMSKMAKGSTEALQQNLNLGGDLLTALSSTTQGTQEAVQQRFTEMETMIGETQSRADALAEAANERVLNTLSVTRKELSKLETDMQVLQSQLSNAREDAAQLDLETINAQRTEPTGFGRLRLTPLETDFPPVEPPRHQPQHPQQSMQAPLNLDDTMSSDALDFDGPINLGADLEIANPDDEITQFDTDRIDTALAADDVVRPAVPLQKGFGGGRNNKNKPKTSWHWRDMLGGLDRPDSEASTATESALEAPLGADMIARLTQAQLSPAAIVDEGTVIEAAKARLNKGPAAMLAAVDSRLNSPVEHLRMQFSHDEELKNAAKTFVTQYGQTLAQGSAHNKSLRETFGASEGRAYLLCAAALSA